MLLRLRIQKNRLPKQRFNAILADDSEMMKEKSLQLGDDFSLFSVFVFIMQNGNDAFCREAIYLRKVWKEHWKKI
jgi:hypothetical protein